MKSIGIVIFACLLTVAGAYSAEIHDLARSGDLESVKRLIETDPSLLNAATERNATPLHYAVDSGHTELAAYLIDKGANILAVDVDGDTPLHWAAFAGQLDEIKLLVNSGAPVDSRNNSRQTPFHYAVLRRKPDAAKLLIELGADINAQDYELQTGLHYAGYRSAELTQLLLDLGADMEIKNDYGRTPLFTVTREGGNREIVEVLLNHGADINTRDKFGESPLGIAAWRGFSGLVDLFLDSGAELPSDEHSLDEILSFAVKRRLVRLFNLAADKGADLSIADQRGGSLLHLAAFGGSVEIAKVFMDRGFDFNLTDRYGWTPLHYAASKGRYDVVELFIDKGVDLDSRTFSGRTAYNLADEKGHRDIMELLASSGADVNERAFPDLKGSFMGQTAPDSIPQLFAADIVSSVFGEHGTVTFTPDGNEAYWSSIIDIPDSGYSYGGIFYSRKVNGRWMPPKHPEFALPVEYKNDVPFVSPDGQRLFFMSRRPFIEGGQISAEHIWYVNRRADGWGDPIAVSDEINGMDLHWQFSISAKNTLCFASSSGGGFGMGDIYTSEFINGEYAKPVNAGIVINSEYGEGTPYLAADESYIVFTRHGYPDASGNGLYVSFKDNAGNWITPQRLRTGICPIVSHNGKYLFFIDTFEGVNNVYWMSADLIEKMQSEALIN